MSLTGRLVSENGQRVSTWLTQPSRGFTAATLNPGRRCTAKKALKSTVVGLSSAVKCFSDFMAGSWGQVVSQNLDESYSNFAMLAHASDDALTAAFYNEVRCSVLGQL